MKHATHESKLCKSDCIDGILSDNVYIYLVYNIALNMSYTNHSRFPSTPPPVLYNTKIHIMPARIILDICKLGCFVSDLLTEIKNNGGGH